LDVHGELESQPTLTVKPNPPRYMGTEIPACHYIMIPLQSLSRKTDGNFRLMWPVSSSNANGAGRGGISRAGQVPGGGHRRRDRRSIGRSMSGEALCLL